MPKYKSEIFGQFVYSPEISYDELLGLENEIKLFITETLELFGGEFLAFESEGDRTFFQCAMPECDNAKASEIAGVFVRRLNKHMECKVMFVDKMLCEHYFYAMNSKGVKMDKITLKAAGPIDRALLAEGAQI